MSRDGGAQPRWSPDERELFFTGLDGRLMSAAVSAGESFSAGTPVSVLAQAYYNGLGLFERPGTFDMAPDGKRFLMLKPVNDPVGTMKRRP